MTTKRFSRISAVVIAVAVLLTCFSFTMPVNAASTPDMKKANVKWDLKNNKTIKYKQYWYTLGAKTHTVKMTKYKVKKASKEGYKQCTFTLTYNMRVKPNKNQVAKMGTRAENDKVYTEFGFVLADYKTGMTLGIKNDKDVTMTNKWKFSKYIKIKGRDGSWIRYPRKTVVNVKIVYPEDYKDLAIGVFGATNLKLKNANRFWNGKIPFSKATTLYSKKDKAFAHFKRVK